jgi:hypothetical protein
MDMLTIPHSIRGNTDIVVLYYRATLPEAQRTWKSHGTFIRQSFVLPQQVPLI